MANNILHLDTSESSAAEDRDDVLPFEERNVRIFAKQMLQGRLFLGHFQERRLVESLQVYRDVIVINEAERNLIHDMSVVLRRLKGFYNRNCWIGITEPAFIGAPNGYCFWAESNSNTFGYYWYKIKGIRIREKEVLIRLKIVRPMIDTDNQIQTTTITNNLNDKIEDVSFEFLLENFKNSLKEKTIWFFTEAMTTENIKQAFTFVSILIVTLTTSAFYGVKYLMEFVLKLMREISVFVQASTPVMIAVVNLVGKIIGGFYILIAMIWKGNSPNPGTQPRINYSQNRHKAIDMPRYRNSEPLTIREIE